MSRFCISALLLLTCGLIALGQSPTPTPSPDGEVVRISTNLIRLDVTVTDRKGKPISDLRPDEIEIFENGEKQKITALTFVAGGRPDQRRTGQPQNGIPVPTAALRPEQVRRTIALVVDDLSLSFESAHHTRGALKKFVDEQMQEGDLVAIVRTGAGIGALQQFTSDKRILHAAIERVRWNATGMGAFSAIETGLPPPTDVPPDQLPSAPVSEGSGENLDDFRGRYFATGTLGALRYVVSGMGELPGRKSVILFSDGFRRFAAGPDTVGFLRSVVDHANRASVVFYTVDARGLVFGGLTAADSATAPTTPVMGEDDLETDALTTAALERRNQIVESQEGLNYLARGTGGFAIKNNNDLAGGVRRILEDQSYYLVAYEPDSDTFDAAARRFNQLEIKVTRQGARARYRSGFFNVADRRATSQPIPTLKPVEQLERALVSPFGASGINVRLNALFGQDPRTGPFVRSLLHINARDLKFTDEKDGIKKAVFDVLAMSFGDNGQVIDQLAKGYTMTLTPEQYRRVISEGFVYQFAFPVKKPGPYQYRVAIRDFQGGAVGAASQFIDVPDVKKDRLTLSSIVLESLTIDQWRHVSDAGPVASNPVSDTALRRVKAGTILRYGFEIYNARLTNAKQPQLKIKARVFRDGQPILDGEPRAFDLLGQTDLRHLKTVGAIALGDKMRSGDYILQIIVTDALAKSKQQIATQFVQFEVVE
jgi:VWFA-related protein